MDMNHLENWLLTEYRTPRRRAPLKPATVDDTLRKMRHLEERGLDWGAFASGPRRAKRLVAPLLVEKMRNEDRPHGARDYQKVLNRVAVYLANQRRSWRGHERGDTWPLSPAVKGGGPRQEANEVAALAGYRGRDGYETRLVHAVLWTIRNTRLRRAEVARIRASSLRRDYAPTWGALIVKRPGKAGHARVLPMPPTAWEPDGALQRFLAVRRRDRAEPDALFTRRDGTTFKAMTPNDMGVLLNQVSEQLGFRVSFNRLRKYEFTWMKRRQVAPWVMLYLHGGSSYKVLEAYLGPITPDEAADEMAAKMWGTSPPRAATATA